MKDGNKAGFEQCYNGQVAVDQASLLIVANTLSNHPNDQQEALPTVDAISPAVGVPTAAALDAGYFSQTNVAGLLARQIDPYIATGREPHHVTWQSLLLLQTTAYGVRLTSGRYCVSGAVPLTYNPKP